MILILLLLVLKGNYDHWKYVHFFREAWAHGRWGYLLKVVGYFWSFSVNQSAWVIV